METKKILHGKTAQRGSNRSQSKKRVTTKLLMTALATLTFGGMTAITDVGLPSNVVQAAVSTYYIQPRDSATNAYIGEPISVVGMSGQNVDTPRVIGYKASRSKTMLPMKPGTIVVAYIQVPAMATVTVNYFNTNKSSTKPVTTETIQKIAYNQTGSITFKDLGKDYTDYKAEVATALNGLTLDVGQATGFSYDNQSEVDGTAVINVTVNGPADFKPKDITYKIGGAKPTIADYVDKDLKGNVIDPVKVKIDESAVKWDQVGSYQVPVTYGGETHQATVTVQAADKPQPVQYAYTVRTIDSQGHDLGRGYTGSGTSGSSISAPTISGYTLTSANNVSLISNGQQITFTYRLNSSTPVTPGTTNPNPGTTNNSGSTVTPSNSSSSSNDGTTDPTNNVPANAAQKGAVVYAINKIGLYNSPDFTKANRKGWYVKQPRIARPMFVVTGYERSQNGTLRYRVRDVNHSSKTAGQAGYITASQAYVRPVYYVTKQSTITVINPRGVNAYRKANLTGKVKNYRQGTVLKVKGIVKHNLTTRYVLTNGDYITANRKLVNMGRHKQVKSVKTKQAINRYSNVNLTKKNHSIAKNRTLKVYGYDYSHKNDVTKHGTLRHRVAGGYITANTKYVRAYQ
ncbi:DUF5776 domain-containing protein [Lentilactobacillus hilgardii]|nr:DUF5776 domain-containing protein [Lentilactobacillus hilgardii]MCV3739955.1 DUF5776 domain-containing protein [Lentilactobacillus hilgardii]